MVSAIERFHCGFVSLPKLILGTWSNWTALSWMFIRSITTVIVTITFITHWNTSTCVDTSKIRGITSTFLTFVSFCIFIWAIQTILITITDEIFGDTTSCIKSIKCMSELCIFSSLDISFHLGLVLTLYRYPAIWPEEFHSNWYGMLYHHMGNTRGGGGGGG